MDAIHVESKEQMEVNVQFFSICQQHFTLFCQIISCIRRSENHSRRRFSHLGHTSQIKLLIEMEISA
jgi:hypothetical protein